VHSEKSEKMDYNLIPEEFSHLIRSALLGAEFDDCELQDKYMSETLS
jgi:hypothetical protein